MDNFPSALIIASFDSVCHNNNVVHRLVRPLPDGSGVQSTDRLVNVVPFRRKYNFVRKQELADFGQQMLRRPLVLQPVLHFGRGLGNCCVASYQDELWLVMVNQTHPKILSRLQMGLDTARLALERGQSFEITFRFGKVIQRVYYEHLAQKEKEEAQTSNSAFHKYLTYFRYAKWEYCDLILRYHGLGAALNRTSAFNSLPNLEMTWDFDDIGMHEMVWCQSNNQVYSCPHLSPISEDEIRQHLPGWTINGVSPLENIGDSIPEYNYDYAQASRLYASFRKKRQSRNLPQQNTVPRQSSKSVDPSDQEYDSASEEDLAGAVGFDPSAQPQYVDPDHVAIEHNFRYPDNTSKPTSWSRQQYQGPGNPNHNQMYCQDIKQPESYGIHQQPHYNKEVPCPNTRQIDDRNAQTQFSNGRHQANSSAALSQPDKYEHIYSNVQIQSPEAPPNLKQTQSSIYTNQYAELDARTYNMHDPSLNSYRPYAGSLQKQDSDRSSRSTNADSGYSAEGDSDRSRGGSYDYNEPGYVPRLKEDQWGYANIPTTNVGDGGLVNPAFSMHRHDVEYTTQKGKEHISKMVQDQQDGFRPKKQVGPGSDYQLGYSSAETKSSYTKSQTDSVGVVKAPPRQKRIASTNSTPRVAESFI